MSALADVCVCGDRRGLHSVQPPFICTTRKPDGTSCKCDGFKLAVPARTADA